MIWIIPDFLHKSWSIWSNIFWSDPPSNLIRLRIRFILRYEECSKNMDKVDFVVEKFLRDLEKRMILIMTLLFNMSLRLVAWGTKHELITFFALPYRIFHFFLRTNSTYTFIEYFIRNLRRFFYFWWRNRIWKFIFLFKRSKTLSFLLKIRLLQWMNQRFTLYFLLCLYLRRRFWFWNFLTWLRTWSIWNCS